MRAFAVTMPSGERYWTVIDEALEVVPDADAFLFHVRFGRDGSELTTKAHAGGIALFLRWCGQTGRSWHEGIEHLGLFMTWLRYAGPGEAGAGDATGQVLAGPGGMRLFDIAADGRLLMSNSRITYSVYASINGAPTRDLSYLDTSYTPTLSNDGKLILFSSGSQASGNLYAVLLRGTDGSPVIHMGQGQSVAISPDNAWAAALLQKERPEIVMLPIGPGEALHPPSANLENAYSAFGWMPDSHRFLLACWFACLVA